MEEIEERVSWKTPTEIIQTSPYALAEKSWEANGSQFKGKQTAPGPQHSCWDVNFSEGWQVLRRGEKVGSSLGGDWDALCVFLYRSHLGPWLESSALECLGQVDEDFEVRLGCVVKWHHTRKNNHVILRLTEILSDRNKLNLKFFWGWGRIAMQITHYET